MGLELKWNFILILSVMTFYGKPVLKFFEEFQSNGINILLTTQHDESQ